MCRRARLRRVGGERDLLVGRNETDDKLLTKPPCGIGADLIGETPRRDPQQPAARVVGPPFAGPLGGGGDERLLDGILTAGEVAIAPGQDASTCGASVRSSCWASVSSTRVRLRS